MSIDWKKSTEPTLKPSRQLSWLIPWPTLPASVEISKMQNTNPTSTKQHGRKQRPPRAGPLSPPNQKASNMNLLHIAWRNMQQRGFATLLTMFSMALGVALVVLVLSISWTITESFDRNSNVGYNLIVGARGGSLQLVLNSVFYLSKPIEVLPYDDYLDFLSEEDRTKEIKRIGGRIANPDRTKGSEFSKYMDGGFAIPICLGDYFGPFRVVGTTPAFFDKLRYGRASDMEYKFSEGRNFVDHSPEHGFFEAVLGSQVAATMNKKVGDTLQTTHGDPEGIGHGEAFTIVGVLAPTGTPNDRAAFINIEGFYKMDNHSRAFVDPAHPDELKVDVPKEPADAPDRLPLEKRDVVAILVKPSNGSYAVFLEKPVNKTMRMQAVSPISEISGMLEMFVAPVKNALLGLTAVVCIVSAISILVSIYNSMSDRRRDIAVMRALGARRDVVLLVVLLESLLIACIGGAVGWFAGHGIGVACADMVEERTGLQIGFFNTITIYELTLIPGLVLLATLAGIIPAFVAYRTDVSKNLGA